MHEIMLSECWQSKACCADIASTIVYLRDSARHERQLRGWLVDKGRPEVRVLLAIVVRYMAQHLSQRQGSKCRKKKVRRTKQRHEGDDDTLPRVTPMPVSLVGEAPLGHTIAS